MTVTGTTLAEELDDPTLVLAMNADSLAANTLMEATCPDTGEAVVWLAPSGTTAPANDEDTIMAALAAYEAA